MCYKFFLIFSICLKFSIIAQLSLFNRNMNNNITSEIIFTSSSTQLGSNYWTLNKSRTSACDKDDIFLAISRINPNFFAVHQIHIDYQLMKTTDSKYNKLYTSTYMGMLFSSMWLHCPTCLYFNICCFLQRTVGLIKMKLPPRQGRTET